MADMTHGLVFHSCQGQKVSAVRGDGPVTFLAEGICKYHLIDGSEHRLVVEDVRREVLY